MELDAIFAKLKEDMSNPVEHVLQEFVKLHTGKSSPAMVPSQELSPRGWN